MNLELLISKYLDGDLTPEEDRLLRKILSEEPSARDEFDSAALLHVEMQNDAESIVPPADLVSETEDMILMKIMNHSVQDSGRPTQFLKSSLRRRVVNLFSVAAVLLAFTIPFNDGSAPEVGSFSAGLQAESDFKAENDFKALQSNLAQKEMPGLLRYGKTLKKSTASSDMAAFFTNSDNAIAFKNPMASSSAEILKEDSAPVEDMSSRVSLEEAQIKSGNVQSIMAIASQYNNSEGSYTPSSYDGYDRMRQERDEVQVSTFLATNVLKSSKAAESSIASISQSVSYAVNKSDRVGVEFGYTSYTYEGNTIVPVKASGVFASAGKDGSNTTRASILGAGDGKPQPPKVDNTKSTWKNKEVAYTDQGKMYWGAAFYERQVLRINNASLHGRLGIGGSGEGGVAYGRVFGKYDVLSIISLTVGAESRALLKSPASVDKPEINAAVSLMYGLQVRF